MSSRKTISIPKGPIKTPVQGARTIGLPDFHDGLEGTHVGGVPIEQIDPAMRRMLLYRQTDEGVAEANATRGGSGSRVTAGPLEKALQRKRDFALTENEPWLAPDPMRAIAEQHVPAGMTPRFLSETRLNKEGNYSRGYEVIKDAKGNPIKLGTLVLAAMPEELAERRAQHYQDVANKALNELNDQTRSKGEGLIRTAQELGIDNFQEAR